MGNCMDKDKGNTQASMPLPTNPDVASQPSRAPPMPASSDEGLRPFDAAATKSAQPSSTGSSDAFKGKTDGSFDRTAPAGPSSEDSRGVQDVASSPMGHPNAALTESALNALNETAGGRKYLASSTGGTTANTRPTDLPGGAELSDVVESVDSPRRSAEQLSVADMPAGTPPPMAEGLPVVSLQDIAVMEQKQGRRGRRLQSRIGSATASHAGSLSAIPENVEITPLHGRSERSDSMRVVLSQHPVSRLADVQELEVESKSNTAVPSRPSRSESPSSSHSLLTSGDDSVMPHTVEAHVEQQYEMLMPILPRPSPYWRFPNATEASRRVSKGSMPPPDESLLGAESPAAGAHSVALSPSRRPSGASGALEGVLTDDSGLQLLSSTVERAGEETVLTYGADELALTGDAVHDVAGMSTEGGPSLAQGTAQQETLRFALPTAVKGLRCVKKYTVGELSWDQTVMMGDFEEGEQSFTMPASTVPSGQLTVGQYFMKTVFMDEHGAYLWAGVNTFRVVRGSAPALPAGPPGPARLNL